MSEIKKFTFSAKFVVLAATREEAEEMAEKMANGANRAVLSSNRGDGWVDNLALLEPIPIDKNKI